MSTSLYEHRVALPLAEEPFTKREIRKAKTLLRRLRWLQHNHTSHCEQERAALLWALTELGVICGEHLGPRTGADLRCVRPDNHGDECDAWLRFDGPSLDQEATQ